MDFVQPAEFRKGDTMRSQVRKYISARIRNGVYKPGDRIVETRLAKELNISQAPVREAILELSIMGLLEIRPYSGTFVRSLAREDIDDIYNTRAFVEEYAASRAAKRITIDEIAAFEPVFAEMRRAAESDNALWFADCDIRFHEMILHAAHSSSLLTMWKMLHLAEWTNITYEATDESLWDIIKAHERIFDHIRCGADRCAGAEMFLHIRRFVTDLERYFSQSIEEDQPTK